MPVLELTAIIHTFATLSMCGVIWFVQRVHYPLFEHVGETGFVQYARHHQARTTQVVMPLMLLELVTSVALLCWAAAGLPRTLAVIGVVLIGVNWASTAFVQVPCHRLLLQHYDVEVVRHLVRTNWLRTVAWSLRAGLALWMAHLLST